jgi:hypothetical protein
MMVHRGEMLKSDKALTQREIVCTLTTLHWSSIVGYTNHQCILPAPLDRKIMKTRGKF